MSTKIQGGAACQKLNAKFSNVIQQDQIHMDTGAMLGIASADKVSLAMTRGD